MDLRSLALYTQYTFINLEAQTIECWLPMLICVTSISSINYLKTQWNQVSVTKDVLYAEYRQMRAAAYSACFNIWIWK